MPTVISRYNMDKVIIYRGKKYTVDLEASRNINEVPEEVPKGHIVIQVLSKNLRGKTDLHGKPYRPSIYLYKHTPSAIIDKS